MGRREACNGEKESFYFFSETCGYDRESLRGSVFSPEKFNRRQGSNRACHAWVRGAWVECTGVRSSGEKLGITHQIVAIEFDLGVLLALDFNRDKFLCVFFWVCNGWRLSVGTFSVET
jgi:hypothetical protein